MVAPRHTFVGVASSSPVDGATLARVDLAVLAEARMLEWLRRPAHERDRAPEPADPAAPLEVQLFHDVGVLDDLARAVDDPAEAARLTAEADRLMMRVSMICETNNRPLAARHFESLRRRA